MPQFPPEQDDVVVVTSEPDGEGGRRFRLDQGDGEDGEDGETGLELDTSGIRHEDDLVTTMKERGYTLTMVGGGSRSDEVRRFYFREER